MLGYLAAGVLLGLVGLWLVNRPQAVHVEADVPAGFPDDGFPHTDFETLLHRFVDPAGRVDYQAWHADAAARDQLAGYLAAVSRYSPDNAPARFPERSDELAYWLYAYNAWVIHAILERWPLASVTDVKAPLELVKGLGFFYRLRFPFGERYYSLYAVENERIRKDYRDARIHFVLNCGSESCPVMRPDLPDGEHLDTLLQQAAVDFVSDPANVRIDHDARRIVLNRIFKWYRRDFINDLARRGLPPGDLLDYVASVAPPALREDLAKARDYQVEFAPYDWSVNAKSP